MNFPRTCCISTTSTGSTTCTPVLQRRDRIVDDCEAGSKHCMHIRSAHMQAWNKVNAHTTFPTYLRCAWHVWSTTSKATAASTSCAIWAITRRRFLSAPNHLRWQTCAQIFSADSTRRLGHGKKIHCFSGKTFPTLEAVGRFFFLKLIQWGNSQETTNRNAKVYPRTRSSTAAVVACNTNNDEKRYSYCTRYCKRR